VKKHTPGRLESILPALVVLAAIASTPAAAEKKVRPASKASQDARASVQLSLEGQRSLELNEQGARAVHSHDFDRAETLFKQALDVDKRNLTAVFNLAGMYMTNKKEADAIELLTRYTADFPSDAGLFARLGDAYFGTQDLQKASQNYEKALTLDAKYPGVPARLGAVYSLQGKLEPAAKMFEQAVKENPRDARSFANLGSLYVSLNKPEQAVANAKRAAQLEGSAANYVTLGAAYQQLKDNKNALVAYERAAALGAKDPELTKVIDELKSERRGAKS
jgi:tetratricopeptide (TPR) repeat protein